MASRGGAGSVETEKVEPWLVQHQNVEVNLRSGKDVYMSRFFEMPNMDSAAGITAMTVVRSGEAERYIHHVSLFGCDEGFEPPRLNISFPDKSEHVLGTGCSRKIHTFNVNTLFFTFPEGYMYSLDSKYMKLTVHYKALHVREIVVDSTGVLTEFGRSLKTVQYLELGPKARKMLSIPPGLARYVVESLCSPDDMAAAMGRLSLNEIEVIGARAHMHLAGTAFKAEVLHSNGSSTPFAVHKVYNTDEDQRSRFLKRSIVVSKGDALKVTCVYNTQGRSHPTRLGFDINDEMCIGGILMSPRLPSFHACYHMENRRQGEGKCTGINERKPFTVVATTDVRGPDAGEAKAAIFHSKTSACLGKVR